MSDYLTVSDIARLIGVTPKTWTSWVARGKAPAADYRLGRTPGWEPATIDEWIAARPGRGARTDLGSTNNSNRKDQR
jgi:predicted DNA-binding transcriptional regulator AlpA